MQTIEFAALFSGRLLRVVNYDAREFQFPQRLAGVFEMMRSRARYGLGDALSLLAAVSLILSAAVPGAQSQSSTLAQYAQKSYQMEQGMPQDEVRSIAQTPDGYLWFATRDGLARFDGVHFTVFNKENTEGIGHDMFGALLVDRHGRLWLATGSGLSCYEAGKFRRYTVPDGLPDDAIHSLLEDRNGNIWVGTWSGLAVFNGSQFRVFGTRDGLGNKAISALATDGRSGVWIGTIGGGLAHFVDGRFLTYRESNGLPSNVIESLLQDSTGELWVGTLRGFARATAAGRFEAVKELPGEAIVAWEDQASHIWASTENFTARLDRARSPRFQREPDLDKFTVATLFQDKEGSLWVEISRQEHPQQVRRQR